MASFKSCQIYHLDTELPGACEGCYWPIHLASFSLAIHTTNNVILIALLCAAVVRLITATLVPSIIATGRPGGELLSSALQLSDRIYLLVVLCWKPSPHGCLFHLAAEYFILKRTVVWGMLLVSAGQVFSSCSFYSAVGSNALAGNKEKWFPFL